MRSNYKIKNPHRDSNVSKERWVEKSHISSLLKQEEELMFEHLNRKCTCGSGDIWSECNGIEGDDSYCG